jgi:hypothetical protein
LAAFDGGVVVASSRRGCGAAVAATGLAARGSGGVSTSSMPCSSSATRSASIFSGSTASSGR